MINEYRKLLRIEQWYKNLVIFLPLIFAPQLTYSLFELIFGFFGLCAASSITYITNDWLDRKKDALHPIKKNRPLASGKIRKVEALIAALLLSLILLFACLYLGKQFSVLILTYLSLTTLYSFGLKNLPLVDIVLIAMNFVVRILAGTNAFPDFKMFTILLFVLFIVMYMLSYKRRSDNILLGKEASKHKPILKFYTQKVCLAVRLVCYLALTLIVYQFNSYGVITLPQGFLILLFLSVTGHLFSTKPQLAIQPHYLFKEWLWLLTSGVLLLSLF